MRTFKLVIVIILLAVLSSACKSTFGDKFEKYFVINDTLSIQKIQISGDSVIILKRIENAWVLNDGVPVNQVAIDNLLLSFTRLEKLAVLRNFEQIDSGRVLLNIESKKRNYFFSFSFSNDAAYIGRIGDLEVYRFGLKGIPEVNLEDIFSDNETHWKNPTLIDFSPNDIMEISISPDVKWGNAFKISKLEGEWSLYDDKGNLGKKENVDWRKLSDYTRSFSGIYFDAEVIDKKTRMKTLSNKSFYTIVIRDNIDKEIVLNIYPNYDESGEYDDFYALMTKSGSESLYLVNYVYLDPLFENYSSFLLK